MHMARAWFAMLDQPTRSQRRRARSSLRRLSRNVVTRRVVPGLLDSMRFVFERESCSGVSIRLQAVLRQCHRRCSFRWSRSVRRLESELRHAAQSIHGIAMPDIRGTSSTLHPLRQWIGLSHVQRSSTPTTRSIRLCSDTQVFPRLMYSGWPATVPSASSRLRDVDCWHMCIANRRMLAASRRSA